MYPHSGYKLTHAQSVSTRPFSRWGRGLGMRLNQQDPVQIAPDPTPALEGERAGHALVWRGLIPYTFYGNPVSTNSEAYPACRFSNDRRSDCEYKIFILSPLLKTYMYWNMFSLEYTVPAGSINQRCFAFRIESQWKCPLKAHKISPFTRSNSVTFSHIHSVRDRGSGIGVTWSSEMIITW